MLLKHEATAHDEDLRYGYKTGLRLASLLAEVVAAGMVACCGTGGQRSSGQSQVVIHAAREASGTRTAQSVSCVSSVISCGVQSPWRAFLGPHFTLKTKVMFSINFSLFWFSTLNSAHYQNMQQSLATGPIWNYLQTTLTKDKYSHTDIQSSKQLHYMCRVRSNSQHFLSPFTFLSLSVSLCNI